MRQLTVTELIFELQEIERAGGGEKPVFIVGSIDMREPVHTASPSVLHDAVLVMSCPE
jgi:hypothetical protein